VIKIRRAQPGVSHSLFQMVSVFLRDTMTVEEFLVSACTRKNLNPMEHFVRVKKRRDMEDHNYFVPHRSDLIETFVSLGDLKWTNLKNLRVENRDYREYKIRCYCFMYLQIKSIIIILYLIEQNEIFKNTIYYIIQYIRNNLNKVRDYLKP